MDITPIVELNVTGAEKITFTDTDQVREWVSKERTFTNFVFGNAIQPYNNLLANYNSGISTEFSRIETILQTFQRNSSVPPLKAALDQYSSGNYVYSESTEGRRLKATVEANGKSEALLEFLLLRNSFGLTTPSGGEVDIRALFRVMLRLSDPDADLERRRNAELLSIDAMLRKASASITADREAYKTAMDRLRTAVEEEVRGFEETHGRAKGRLQKFDKDREKISKAVWNAVRAVKEESRAELQAMHKTYHDLLRLEAPAQYWKDRASSNRRNAWTAFGAFVVLAVVLTGLVLWEGKPIKAFFTGVDGKVDLGALALGSPFVILVIWLFRMIGRVFSVNFTESIDADQRRVMTTTYLALSKDPTTQMAEADRAIILQALFRSSSVKDDSADVPTNAVEAAAKIISGKAS